MKLDYLPHYLLIINCIGFFAYIINMLLYARTEKGQIDGLLTILSLLGGTLGILIAILLFDRKPEKENMMSRVFVICIFVIQLILILIWRGTLTENLTFAFWDFFERYQVLVIYLIVINFASFALFALDKVNAVQHKKRIRIVTLLGVAFIGGSLGGLLAMYILRHKTKQDYFTVGIPLIIMMQVVVLFYVMNLK